MKVIENWDLDENFWALNPKLKGVEVFYNLFKSDKTINKNKSSQLMWGFAYLLDVDSIYNDLYIEERKDLVAKDVLKDPKFKWDTYKEFIDAWNAFKSPIEVSIDNYKRLLGEREVYMNKLKFEDDSEEIEKRMLTTGKLHDEYEKLKARLENKETGVLKGQGSESISEKGLI